MFIVSTVTMVKDIVFQRDCGNSGKDCKAICKALGVPISTVRAILKNEEEHHVVTQVKGRGRKSKIFL